MLLIATALTSPIPITLFLPAKSGVKVSDPKPRKEGRRYRLAMNSDLNGRFVDGCADHTSSDVKMEDVDSITQVA